MDGLTGGHADGDLDDDDDDEGFDEAPILHDGAVLLVSTPGFENANCKESASLQNCFSSPFAGLIRPCDGTDGILGAGRIIIPGWLSSEEVLLFDKPLNGGASNSSLLVWNCGFLNVV